MSDTRRNLRRVYAKAAALLAEDGVLVNADFVVAQGHDDPRRPRRFAISQHVAFLRDAGFAQAQSTAEEGVLGCIAGRVELTFGAGFNSHHRDTGRTGCRHAPERHEVRRLRSACALHRKQRSSRVPCGSDVGAVDLMCLQQSTDCASQRAQQLGR